MPARSAQRVEAEHRQPEEEHEIEEKSQPHCDRYDVRHGLTGP
jgi:hypothetical protein